MSIIYKQCPRCNSKDVLTIRYGEPGYVYPSSKYKEYYEGGCCIPSDENGETLFEYHCKSCGLEYNKAEAAALNYGKITSISGHVGGYLQGYKNYQINLITGEVFYSNESEDKLKLVKKLNKLKTLELICDLKSSNILTWRRTYINKYILEGIQWGIIIDIAGSKRVRIGSNKYPKEWDFYCNVISCLVRDSLK